MKKFFTARNIAQLALLIALYFVLDRISLFTIPVSFLKISFAFIPVIVAAMLFGPVGGALVNGLGDLIGALVLPFGPYHPGFTICGALIGACFGFFLHMDSKTFKNNENPRVWPNVIVPVVFGVLVGMFLNTLWVAQLYSSKTYWGYFVPRAVQEVVIGALKLILTPLVLAPLARKLRKLGYRR